MTLEFFMAMDPPTVTDQEHQVMVKNGTNSALVPPFAAQKMVSAIRRAISRTRMIFLPSNRYFAKVVRFPLPYPRLRMLSAVMIPPSKAQLVRVERIMVPFRIFSIREAELLPAFPIQLLAAAICLVLRERFGINRRIMESIRDTAGMILPNM